MSEPSPAVRAVVYERDSHRCCACGAPSPLSFQHRQAVGMGGSRFRPLYVDGVTLCVLCNQLVEGVLQDKALRYGWKARRWVKDVSLVPCFYQWSGVWCVLGFEGDRTRITRADAERRMLATYGDEWLGWAA